MSQETLVAVLADRIAELERRCQRKNHRIYMLRLNRDVWKARARHKEKRRAD